MGKIKVTSCDIEGLYVIEPTVFKDERGYFVETYTEMTPFEWKRQRTRNGVAAGDPIRKKCLTSYYMRNIIIDIRVRHDLPDLEKGN